MTFVAELPMYNWITQIYNVANILSTEVNINSTLLSHYCFGY